MFGESGQLHISHEQVREVVGRTIHSKPLKATQSHSLARTDDCQGNRPEPPATVQRIWKGRGPRPHRVRAFKLSRDPRFLEKLKDVARLYLPPPEKAIVFSVEERSKHSTAPRKQFAEWSQPL